jgi:peptidoglycan hydrolase CwlO-like protein
LLYWWQVLEDEQMLQVTLTVFPNHLVGNNDSVPSVLTMSSNKRKKSDMHDGMLEKIGSVVDTLTRSNAIQDRVNDLNDKRFRSEQRKENREERKEIRDVEREIESMEDQLGETQHEGKRRRLQVRIDKLQDKISKLEAL